MSDDGDLLGQVVVPEDGAPATVEELSVLAAAVTGGYPGYSLEILRRNRRIALPLLEALVNDIEAREKWAAMGLPGDLPPRRPGLRWRVETHRDLTGFDEEAGTGDVVEVVVFATRWAKPGTAARSRKARVDLVCSTLSAAGARGLVRGTNYGESGGSAPDGPHVAWGEGTTPAGEPFMVRVNALPERWRSTEGIADA